MMGNCRTFKCSLLACTKWPKSSLLGMIKINFKQAIFVQIYNPIEFPSGPYEHIPDPTAEDSDMIGAQPFYAPHWGNVRPFGHKSGADLPDFLPEPLTLDYAGNFSEVKELGMHTHLLRHMLSSTCCVEL